MIVSFHPCFAGDINLICAGRDPGSAERAAIEGADAVILPQGCRRELYEMARRHCPNVFPGYDARFRYPGKDGQIRLFEQTGLPHPRTRIYPSWDQLGYEPAPSRPEGFEFPFVVKFSWGGEGETVFLIASGTDFHAVMERARQAERSGQRGGLIQEHIPTNRSLRVVRIGETYRFYWRIAPPGAGFGTAVSGGARIDPGVAEGVRIETRRHLDPFCQKTGINLAGFDVLFSDPKTGSTPYFIEINYFFGRKGLGGSAAYYRLLETEIARWIERLGLIVPAPDRPASKKGTSPASGR